MKRIISVLLTSILWCGVIGCSPANNSGNDLSVSDIDSSETSDEVSDMVDNKTPNSILTDVCSFDTVSYDLAELIGKGSDFSVTKNGQALDSTTVRLDVGTNVFRVSYNISGIERLCEIRIARRDKYRVVLNSNGGSFVETQYVEDCGTIDMETVTPTRDRYTFMGWYNTAGIKINLSTTPIAQDTVLVARWSGPNEFSTPSKAPETYTTSSAALNIVWKDYANAFDLRPTEILCELKNTTTNATYTVKVTKDSAEFLGNSPMGSSIAQGEGNWTVKITGLTDNYTFVQNSLENDNYTTVQSGTSVTNTLKYYEPIRDDSTKIMTENGRFYDIAGNLVVLKGVVPWNVDHSSFVNSTSSSSLKRLQQEGCNVIRITVPLGKTTGYQNIDAEQRNIYISKVKGAVDRAAELGMYCIVDWGVMANTDKEAYFESILEPAKEFFGTLSDAYTNHPYVLFELANEPTHTSWVALRNWEEQLIRCIRANDPYATIIAAPNMHSRRLSDDSAPMGDDPIDKPFPTDISHNIAYTFHCYAYTTTYNVDYSKDYREDAVYGWRVCDAIKNGLTIVITEFSPANASMSYDGGVDEYGLDADYNEANKWLNFILENDLNYTMFRFGELPSGSNKVKAQFMFNKGNEKYANSGNWSYDMLSESGRWYYDNVLHTTGFIKAADFDYRYEYI